MREMKLSKTAEKAFAKMKKTGRLPTSYPIGINLYQCEPKNQKDWKWLISDGPGQIIYVYSATKYNSRFNYRGPKGGSSIIKAKINADVINSDYDICCIRDADRERGAKKVWLLNCTNPAGNNGKVKWTWLKYEDFQRFVLHKL